MKVVHTKFIASPFTDLLVEVVVHPTERCLMAFYRKEHGPGQKLWAFCAHGSPTAPEDPVASLHFCRRTINATLIAHEVTHATDAVLAEQRLTGSSEYVSEIRAETAERITREVLIFCRGRKIKVALVDERR